MNLKEVLGDAYKDGMTFEEISNFFEGKKFADLSTGNYVDKNKYDSEVKDLKNKLSAKENELKGKLSAEEQTALEQKQKDDEIERLKKLLTENTINGNKNTVNSILTNVREKLELESTDKDFNTFVETFTTEDSTKSTLVANYVSKLVNDAYEKGKQDANKNDMGNFGKSKGEGSKATGADELGAFGKKLASLNAPTTKKFNYFE